MNISTYSSLTKLRQIYGPHIFGKICQKFVALAFRRGGCQHIVEREVQGVDIDAVSIELGRLAVEIKTTIGDAVVYQKKDADCLRSRINDGYKPIFGVLRLSLFSDWYFVNAKQLTPGTFPLTHLRALRCRKLSQWLSPLFDDVVEKYYFETRQNSQNYLDEVLNNLGIPLEVR